METWSKVTGINRELVPSDPTATSRDWTEQLCNYSTINSLKTQRTVICFLRYFWERGKGNTSRTRLSSSLIPLPSSVGFARQQPTNFDGYLFRTLSTRKQNYLTKGSLDYIADITSNLRSALIGESVKIWFFHTEPKEKKQLPSNTLCIPLWSTDKKKRQRDRSTISKTKWEKQTVS